MGLAVIGSMNKSNTLKIILEHHFLYMTQNFGARKSTRIKANNNQRYDKSKRFFFEFHKRYILLTKASFDIMDFINRQRDRLYLDGYTQYLYLQWHNK